jgi:hypothetical protein
MLKMTILNKQIREKMTLCSYMIKFSVEVPKCIEQWAQVAANCKGDPKCIDFACKQLRECLDAIFPPSGNIESEKDKINYIFSSVFLLSNRLAKATIALAELDATFTSNLQESEKKENMKKTIDEIISRYF